MFTMRWWKEGKLACVHLNDRYRSDFIPGASGNRPQPRSNYLFRTGDCRHRWAHNIHSANVHHGTGYVQRVVALLKVKRGVLRSFFNPPDPRFNSHDLAGERIRRPIYERIRSTGGVRDLL